MGRSADAELILPVWRFSGIGWMRWRRTVSQVAFAIPVGL